VSDCPRFNLSVENLRSLWTLKKQPPKLTFIAKYIQGVIKLANTRPLGKSIGPSLVQIAAEATSEDSLTSQVCHDSLLIVSSITATVECRCIACNNYIQLPCENTLCMAQEHFSCLGHKRMSWCYFCRLEFRHDLSAETRMKHIYTVMQSVNPW